MTSLLENYDSQPSGAEVRLPLVREGNASGRLLVRELCPAPDPVDCFRHLATLPHVLFLDSAVHREELGRYSYLTADPFRFLEMRDGQFWIDDKPQQLPTGKTPLDLLRSEMAAFASPREAGLPPFQGGAAGVFGYDLVPVFRTASERSLADDFQLPDLSVGLYDWVMAWDHHQKRAWIVSTGFPEMEDSRRRRRAASRLSWILRQLNGPHVDRTSAAPATPSSVRPGWDVPGFPGLQSNFDPERYAEVLRQAIEYIHAGDCFQVNVAQRLRFPFADDAVSLYLRLRERNPATFAGFFDQGDFVLASASPERFLQLDDGIVHTRPIKGTRPRGADPASDAEQSRALASSAKDRAENVMIVDLLRNDLGRVCTFGSIDVPALCEVESFAYVHHLVSEVRGRLRQGQGAVDLLRAAFPGGSITGAPKIRAMEIITELENCARGWYCGSLGYLGFNGTMDTNLLIRSFVLHKGWAQFSVGGGIVADSIPEREYEETWHKAKGMLRALIS